MRKPSQALAGVAGSFTMKLMIIGAAVIGGTAIVSTSVFAALSATASNATPQTISTGTLSVSMTPSTVTGITGGFSTDILNMAPGDTVNRYVDLKNIANTGLVDTTSYTLSVVDTAPTPTPLVTNATTGLQVTVKMCSVPWTSAGVCSGTSTTLVASAPLSTVIATPKSLGITPALAPGFASGTTPVNLQFSITLPPVTEATVNGVVPTGSTQGQSTDRLTWTFTELARAGTTTNA